MSKKIIPLNKKSPVRKNNDRSPKKIYYTIIFLFAFLLYGNTIQNDYSLDDNLVVYKNEQVMKGVKSIPEILTSHYRESERNEYGYRPIAKITFAIESEFFKQNPHISHFINVLLYALLLILLFKLLNSIFSDTNVSLNFIIILLFASHPLHTEVVASLKNREELLCFLFAAAASMFLLRAINEQKKRITMIFLGITCLAFSILSKQTGMVFCIIIPLILLQFHSKPLNFKIINQENKVLFKKYLFFIVVSILLGVFMNVFFRNNVVILLSLILLILFPVILLWTFVKQNNYNRSAKPKDKSLFKRYISFSLLSLMIIILGYSFYKIPEIMLPSGNKPLYGYENPLFTDNSFHNRIGLGFISLLYYFKLIFVPFPLSFYYGYNMVPLAGMGDFRVILSILIHISLFIVSIYNFYKNKLISFGILFYLIGLAMFANWFTVIPGIIGERLLFVSSFGFCIAISGVFWILLNKKSVSGNINSGRKAKFFYTFLAAIILLFSVLTINRNKDWKSYSSLYTADIIHLDNSAKANSLYADEIMRQEYENNSKNKPVDKAKIEIALNHYKRSVEIYPDYSSAYNNIGIIYMFYKNYKSAIYYLIKSENIDSLNSQTDYNLAIAYDNTGDTVNALNYYEKAALKDSTNVEFISHWANLLNKSGEKKRAIEINLHLAKINPLTDMPYINIGNYYYAKRDTVTAVKYWEKAIEIVPDNNSLNSFLAEYFRKRGDEKKFSFYNEKKILKVK